jgi:cytochrome c553
MYTGKRARCSDLHLSDLGQFDFGSRHLRAHWEEDATMKNSAWILFVALLALSLIATAAPQQAAPQGAQPGKGPLPWAYGADTPPPPPTTPGTPPAPPDTSLKHVAGSDLAFTLAQARDPYGPADWHPGDHGPMPDIVAHGKRPEMVLACSLCHYPNGKGRAENAAIDGLPVAYFIQQMNDFKNGLRNSAEPRKANTKRMAAFAKAMSDDEIKAAAEYFGSIPYTPWYKVVESKTAPKTRNAGGLFLKLEGNETEPIGNRLVEVADNTEATETLRDDHSPFTVYAPIGSIKKGEVLVTTGGAGKTVQCGICHGANLEGLGPIPPLAGRSPSYLARQIYDIQHGARNGPWSPLMQRAVEKLTSEDIVAITAYIASRPVPAVSKVTSASNP